MGTPLLTSDQPEHLSLITTLCFLSLSRDSIEFATRLSITMALTFSNSLRCCTLSNAFWKSKNITSTGYPWSTLSVTVYINCSKLVKQERLLINPCWDSLSKLFTLIWLMIESLIIDSRILHTCDVRLTGQ